MPATRIGPWQSLQDRKPDLTHAERISLLLTRSTGLLIAVANLRTNPVSCSGMVSLMCGAVRTGRVRGDNQHFPSSVSGPLHPHNELRRIFTCQSRLSLSRDQDLGNISDHPINWTSYSITFNIRLFVQIGCNKS